MSDEDNKLVLQRFWAEIFNARDLDLIDELFAEGWTYHGMQELHGGHELKHFLNVFFTAFPDLKANIEDLISEKDKVVSRASCTGTHKGELMGFAPTGKEIIAEVICISRLENGKIIEDWELVDMFGIFVQIGAIPMGAGAQG
ncbi:ester cyclase [uncultured Methanolobus sp.]|uniref:ester cyclase n=1 Tax=uncultured Methanolobus sp. TaxID=218300 RepID=UPI0029C60F9B|nr:ester cyclase [uncultured Methanolobus sp.]